ncbi:IclR family transcriptional regulator domain-containing protein [Arthrobacter halodurans]|uniref:IclR family transcriptional regulator C-terminal domain-containing protein n=1 Tax=Arthrobacter halodurans TaxID=516699 RepID=A0ABV4USI1_9MICC
MAEPGTTQQPEYYVKSAEKTLGVLLAFNGGAASLTVTQVADAADLSRAAARRFLLTLTDLGYVVADGNAYRLTPRVLDVGAGYLAGLSLPRVARPHLTELAHRLDETATLSTLDGQDAIYVARVAAPRLHTVTMNIGNRLPAWVTSMGRVLVAALPEEARERFYRQTVVTSYTSSTVGTLEQLRAEIDKVRGQGWCLVSKELDDGLSGLAVPVRRGDEVIAALNISVQAGRLGSVSIEHDLVPALQETARRIAEDFGGRTV